jgi:lipoprotein-anchoring transpeptidase ErfK/SrfK
MYRAQIDEGFKIPPVDTTQMDPRFWRRIVEYESTERVGTLVVDTPAHYLYHVMQNGRAMRYGVGAGREGFAWAGRAVVAYGRKWPRWIPQASMIKRQPELGRYGLAGGGMAPGLANPLGAGALYIHEGGKDTLYRLHGTNEPGSIGSDVSSGCIRLLSQDIIHLYDNVREGTRIVVLPNQTAGALFG